tara:strand:- start:972 stop:3386 length:2415 start_codon:yes stop_codon:yes gene_type:complete
MNINQWRNYLAESKPERLLREITEDELLHIQQALDEMSNEDLAFNKIFDGKMRVVLDFKTMDKTSALGTFVNFFKVNGYEVDWNKGMLSGVQELHDTSVSNQVAGLGLATGGQEYKPPQKKKIQMKVGKYLKKVADLYTKQQQYFQKIVAYSRENQIYGRTPERPGQVTGTLEGKALTPEEQENYRRIGANLDMYDPKVGRGMAASFAQYWAKNAEFIKDKIGTLENDRYSIIITRHPIDVLRMSDFDDITSCHSPPSRGTGESYYKCAVAEAHGHGAVAYVVETEHLKEWAGDPNASLEEIEDEMQTGEIFDDDRRYDAGSIEPVSRLRLRQVRYYEATQTGVPKTDDYKKAGRNPFDGIQLAIPEKRVYGEKIPGFRDRVMKWATEAQQKQMQIVRRDSEPDNDQRVIQLDKFIKFGGSYEDNSIGPLIADFFGNEAGDGLPANTTGYVKQDTTTEDELDANLVGGLMEQFQAEVDDIADRWNNRYAYMEVEASAEDDGGGSVYIEMQAHMKIRWDADEWATMPGYQEARYAAMELNDIGWGWVDSDGVNMQSDATRGEIIYSFAINFEGIMDGPNNMGEGRRGYAVDPEEFEDFCVALNTIDDTHDGVKEMLERFYKREGYMQGGELGRIAREIIDGDLDTEWDMEPDDRYDWDEVTQIDAIAKFDFGAFDPPLPEHNPAVAKAIAEDRDFQIQFRKAIHESAQRKMNTEYFVDTYWRVYLDTSNDVIMECNLRVNDRSKDEQVSILEQIVTDNFDLDDLRDSVLRPLVIQAMNSRMPSGMQQSFNENARIVKSWKSFLKG